MSADSLRVPMPEIAGLWTCPSCGRRVPGRVAECRCGFQHTDAPPPEDAAPEAAPASRARGLLLAGVVAVGCGVLAIIPLRSSVPSAGKTSPAVPSASSSPAPTADAESSAPFVAPVVGSLVPRPADGNLSLAASDASTPASLEDVVSSVIPAVVSIHAGRSRGTGFYFKPGYVLTNVHVIEGQTSVEVTAGETKRSARVVGTSPGADLAVLQVYNPDPQQAVLRLGTARSLRVGQEVIAVGSALGVLSNTVTRGIVSGVRRAGDVTLIQTDAAINPGNSGGPLVDRTGQVIGVNTLKISRVAEAIGFAVAIDHAQPLLGGQSSMTASAPVSGLNDMLRGGAPSQGDQMREQGEEQYVAVLEWASHAAAQIDGYWNRGAATCVGSSSASGDRAWFAVLEPNGVRLNAQIAGCDDWLANVKANADQVRSEVAKAGEAARRSGVYPGVMRDLRRRHRMEWTGFER